MEDIFDIIIKESNYLKKVEYDEGNIIIILFKNEELFELNKIKKRIIRIGQNIKDIKLNNNNDGIYMHNNNIVYLYSLNRLMSGSIGYYPGCW